MTLRFGIREKMHKTLVGRIDRHMEIPVGGSLVGLNTFKNLLAGADRVDGGRSAV